MTNQEIFNKVFDGLKRQGFKRSRDEYGCMYRGPEGLKCAAGHLIPDNLYTPNLETRTVTHSLVRKVLELCGVADLQLDLVNALQEAHDYPTNGTMEDKLIAVATSYGLGAPSKAMV